MPQPSWRGSKVVLATFYMFIGYPLHGIELTGPTWRLKKTIPCAVRVVPSYARTAVVRSKAKQEGSKFNCLAVLNVQILNPAPLSIKILFI